MQREGQALALRATRRSRDREGLSLALRGPETIAYTENVVREHLLPNGSRAGALELQMIRAFYINAMRGTGPRATEPEDDFLHQYNARDRPSRYETRKRFMLDNPLVNTR